MTLRNKSFTHLHIRISANLRIRGVSAYLRIRGEATRKSFSFSDQLSTRIKLQQKQRESMYKNYYGVGKNCLISLLQRKCHRLSLLLSKFTRGSSGVKRSLIYWFFHTIIYCFHQANGFCVGPVFFAIAFYILLLLKSYCWEERGKDHSISFRVAILQHFNH